MLTGGKAIGAGSYGCVFRPPLACRYSDRKTGQISKLMTRHEANKEMARMSKVREMVPKGSKIAKHILLTGAEMCVPAQLTPRDFRHFDKECRAPLGLSKRVSLGGFNRARSAYRVINMLDGGQAMSTVIPTIGAAMCRGKYEPFKAFNTKLVSLVKEAVFPMNKIGLVHLDVKPANIVTNQRLPGKPLALIDWGLASAGREQIYIRSYNKPLQYNLPFTCILVRDTINREIADYLRQVDGKPTLSGRGGLAEYLLGISIRKNPGHVTVVKESISLIDPSLNPTLVVTNYLAAALEEFSVSEGNGIKFQTNKFVDEVFSKNADVWGSISCYADLLEVCNRPIPLTDALKGFLVEYMFSPKYAARPIPQKKLILDMQNLRDMTGARNRRKTRRRTRR